MIDRREPDRRNPPTADLLYGLPCAVAVRDAQGCLVLANKPYEEIVGIAPPGVVRGAHDLAPLRLTDADGKPIPANAWPAVAALSGHPVRDLTMAVTHPDGRKQWLRVDSKAIEDPALGALTVTTYVDVTERWQAEQAARAASAQAAEMVALLQSRHREQAGIAELGRLALVGTAPPQLMEHAVALVASALDADRVRILERLPDGKTLLLRAGIGWRPELVGTATISLQNTQVGYLFESNEHLIVEDFRSDGRFEASWLLREHPVTSGIRAVIRGESGPWGEVAAYTTEFHHFAEEDVLFMRTVANTLAEAFIRLRAEAVNEQTLQRLREVNEVRQRLLQRLSDVVEEERNRIAADIHDDSLQVLAGLGMKLQLIAQKQGDPDLKQALRDVNVALSDAGRRLRRLIFDLRPDTLELGLAPALRFYFEQTATGADPELVVKSSLPEEPPRATRLMVYRACQEALHNVRKHARASHVWVRLDRVEGRVAVVIEDDGVGFDSGQGGRPGHIGLVAMEERIRLAGGGFHIQSGPGEGTSVRFWLPQPSAG